MFKKLSLITVCAAALLLAGCGTTMKNTTDTPTVGTSQGKGADQNPVPVTHPDEAKPQQPGATADDIPAGSASAAGKSSGTQNAPTAPKSR
jgi:uncharacterized lipoprotein YajG